MNMHRTFFFIFVILSSFFMKQISFGETYRKTLECNGVGVFVSDKPRFEKDGFEVYVSAFRELVLVFNGKVFNCIGVGMGWKLEGFLYGKYEINSSNKVLLFKISGEGSKRYFAIREKREVYCISEIEDSLIISDKPSVPPGTPINVIQTWQGRDSKIVKAEYRRINSNTEWRNLWLRHDKDKRTMPEINFQKHMVIAILLGKRGNTSGVSVVDVREIENIIRFRYKPNCYQTGWKGDINTPFGFFVIPCSNKKIKLEEGIQRFIGGPRRWKVITEFDEF